MRFKPIKDFLVYIEDCHRTLAELYQRLSLEANDEKVKLLLEYMKNKEQISYAHLHQYIQQAPACILETWLDNFFDQSFPQRCLDLKFKPDLTIEDVVSLAIKLDTQLIEAMQSAATCCPTEETEKVLENLSSQEEDMMQQVVMASHEFEYM